MDCYNKLWNMSKDLRVLPTAPSQTKWVSPYHGKRHECSTHSSYRQLHTSPRHKYPSLVWKTDFVHLSHCNFSLYYRSFFWLVKWFISKYRALQLKPVSFFTIAFVRRFVWIDPYSLALPPLDIIRPPTHRGVTSKTSSKTSKICMYIICFKMLRNPQKMNG